MGNEGSKHHQQHVDSASTAAATAAAAKHYHDHERYSDTPLYLWINKKKFEIPRDISPQMNLNTYLRDVINLTGTKVMCSEGGCGSCLVHVTKHHPTEANEMEEFSVNSCLTPLLSCAGWQITTIEGIGDTGKPHEVQKRMQEFNGTQCGYCTPGFCMQQYSTLKGKCCNETKKRRDGSQAGDGALTEIEMWENAFDGNICRCTGFRPILDCAKSYVKNKPDMTKINGDAADIEDLAVFTGSQQNNDRAFAFRGGEDGGKTMWYRPTTFEQLWQIMNGYAKGTATVRLVAGNTGEGVFKSIVPFNVYIDIKLLPDLSNISFSPQKAEIGSLVTLSNVIEQFELNNEENFSYLKVIAAHIRRVANHPVRNAGTWAGNLMVKHNHPSFPSDLCTLMTVAQAQIEVRTESGVKLYSVPEFMQVEEVGRTAIVSKLILPPHPPNETVFYSFKVTPREQNAHAHVNAAFLLPIRDGDPEMRIYDTPTIAYGGVNPHFIRAVNTEAALRGASVVQLLQGKNGELSKVLSALSSEIVVSKEDEYEKGKVEYRARLTRNVLYKMLIYAVEAKKQTGVVDPRVRNAWNRIERPISSGKQDFETVKKDYPLTMPMPKVEALMQTTGQLQYTSDLYFRNQLYAAPVHAPAGPAKLLGLTTTEAERVPGFVRILTSKDIPGVNSCVVEPLAPEVLMVDINGGTIEYAGQTVALVLAETQPQAEAIAKLVGVQYHQTGKPLLTCQDAIRENSFHLNKMVGEKDYKVGDVEKGFKESVYIAEGEVCMDQQYHFHMETQVAVAEPTNDGNTLVVHAGTQWPDHVLSAVAAVCNIHASQCDVVTRPLGGAYGAKITRNMPIACLAALGAHITRRPVKLHLSLWDNMKKMGCRYPYLTKYKIGVDADKKLKAVHITSYCNMGIHPNDYGAPFSVWGDNAYKCDNWFMEPKICKTNIPPQTHTRAPGSTEACFFIETAMEHAAHAVGIDPLEFRRINYYKEGDTTFHEDQKEDIDGHLQDVPLDTATDELLRRIDYEARKREIAEFNANNRWKKRGCSIVPLKYAANYTLMNYNAQVVIHHADGSVAITHGGVEIGQGVNTKAAQIAAYHLGVPMEKVTVKPTLSLTSASSMMTGASITSEMVAYSVKQACLELQQRMSEASVARKALGAATAVVKDPTHMDEATWLTLVQACYNEGVDLTARHWLNGLKWSGNVKDKLSYSTYAAMYCEMELDVLTGEKQVRHLEHVHDIGQSISPLVDIGQTEGAIVFGLGLYLTEFYVRDEDTGKLLTHRTWEYKPPSSKDIPAKFNITFLRDRPNKLGMLRSKLIGEPPLLATCSAIFALQHAVREARRELRSGGAIGGATNFEGASNGMEWIQLDSPATCEKLELLCDVKAEHLVVGNV